MGSTLVSPKDDESDNSPDLHASRHNASLSPRMMGLTTHHTHRRLDSALSCV
jgi:hypothetical protein